MFVPKGLENQFRPKPLWTSGSQSC